MHMLLFECGCAQLYLVQKQAFTKEKQTKAGQLSITVTAVTFISVKLHYYM